MAVMETYPLESERQFLASLGLFGCVHCWLALRSPLAVDRKLPRLVKAVPNEGEGVKE